MGPPISELVQHPACAGRVQAFINRVATPKEKRRAVELLSSLQPQSMDSDDVQMISDDQKTVQHTSSMHRQAKEPVAPGWTYAATRKATQLSITPGKYPKTGFVPASPSPRSVSAPRQYDSPRKQAFSEQTLDASSHDCQQFDVSKKEQGIGSSAVEVSPNATTYQLAFHLAQMYPDLYAKAMLSAQAKPAPNFTFKSAWGESLKQGIGEEWQARFLRTMYDIANDEVYPGSKEHGTSPEAEANFYRWLARQQTYYRTLLKAGTLQAVDEQLLSSVFNPAAGNTQPPRLSPQEVLDTLRQLHAVARPDLYVSHSQAIHGPMVPCEDPELTAMVREQTRLMTMGRPPPRVEGTYPTLEPKVRKAFAQDAQQPLEPNKVEVVFSGPGTVDRPFTPRGRAGMPKRPSSSCSMGPGLTASEMVERIASVAGLSGTGTQPKPRPASASAALQTGKASKGRYKAHQAPLIEKETFISKVPIKMAVAGGIPASTYTDAFGSLAGGAAARLAGSGQFGPVKYREVTCPVGAVNPHTAMAPARPAYPVPKCFTTSKAFPSESSDPTMTTVSRATYAARNPEESARLMKAAKTASAHAKGNGTKSTLPMGKNAICLLASQDWKTDYQGEFVPREAKTLAEDFARARELKQLLGGPTASTGRLTAQHPAAPRSPGAITVGFT